MSERRPAQRSPSVGSSRLEPPLEPNRPDPSRLEAPLPGASTPPERPRSECGFCKGKPVHNAAAWTSLGVPRYAACPRCGVLREPEEVE
jgi:rubredoxin